MSDEIAGDPVVRLALRFAAMVVVFRMMILWAVMAVIVLSNAALAAGLVVTFRREQQRV